jgi:hypothetical protein
MSDLMFSDLPPGVHPADPSTADHHNRPVPATPGEVAYTRGRKAWATTNPNALPVFQRLAQNWATGVWVVSSTIGGGTLKVAQLRRGRTRLTCWVPTSFFPGGGVLTATPAGVIIAEDEGKAQQGEGAPLFIGDSVDIAAEGSVWAAIQPGQATGVVAWLDCWDAEAQGSEM